jgi:hypothetical protein
MTADANKSEAAVAATDGAGGKSGQTLLQYLKGGGSSTYMLSGFTVNNWSLTPLSALDYGTGSNSNESTATWPTVTVGKPGYPGEGGPATDLTPAIANVFTVAGPNVDSGGKGFFIATAPSTPTFTANAPPNDWLSLSLGAQDAGCILDLVISFANPAGSGNNPWPHVINPGTDTYNTFIGYLDALVPSLLKINKPFIVSPPGELNLGAGGFTNGQNWMESNNCTSLQAATLFQVFAEHLMSRGIKNALFNFEFNLGAQPGPYLFGYPGPSSGLSKTYADVISCDSQPIYLDSNAYAAMKSTGLPMFYGSAILSGNPGGQAAFSMNTYTNGAEVIAGSYPDFFGAIWWPTAVALNLQYGAKEAMSTFPWIDRTKVPSFSKAGGLGGD